MARQQNPAIKYVLIALIAILAVYVFYNFGFAKTTKISNDAGRSFVLINEEQTFHISMPVPVSEVTDTHFTEQYGRWILVTDKAEIIESGKPVKISNGVYESTVTLKMPKDYATFSFAAEVTEYPYDAVAVGSDFVKGNGSVIAQEEFPLSLTACTDHVDCNLDNICLGQFGYCTSGVCEMKGTCNSCKVSSDCTTMKEAVAGKQYSCVNAVCVEQKEPGLQEQINKIIGEPLTQPGQDPNKPKEVPQLLSYALVLLIIAIVYLLYQRNGRKWFR